MASKNTVSINQKLYEIIENKIQESQNEFSNVEEYINFVLAEILNDDINQMEDEETKKVEYELKKLGYI